MLRDKKNVVFAGWLIALLALNQTSFAEEKKHDAEINPAAKATSTRQVSDEVDFRAKHNELIQAIKNFEGKFKVEKMGLLDSIFSSGEPRDLPKAELRKAANEIKAYREFLSKCLTKGVDSSEHAFASVLNDLVETLLKGLKEKSFNEKELLSYVKGVKSFLAVKADEHSDSEASFKDQDAKLSAAVESIAKSLVVEIKDVKSDPQNKILNAIEVAKDQLRSEKKKDVKVCDLRNKKESSQAQSPSTDTSSASPSSTTSTTPATQAAPVTTPTTPTTPSATEVAPQGPEGTPEEAVQQPKNPNLDDLLKLALAKKQPKKEKKSEDESLKELQDAIDNAKKLMEALDQKNEPKKQDEDKNPWEDLLKGQEPKKKEGGEKGGQQGGGQSSPQSGGGKEKSDPKMPQPEQAKNDKPMDPNMGGQPLNFGNPSGSNSSNNYVKEDRKPVEEPLNKAAAPSTDDVSRGFDEYRKIMANTNWMAQQAAMQPNNNSGTIANKLVGAGRKAAPAAASGAVKVGNGTGAQPRSAVSPLAAKKAAVK